MFPYPFSYFSSIFTPRAIFTNRKVLTVWQGLFTSIFLIALLLIPISLQSSSLTNYPLENFVEGIYTPLTDEVMTDLAQSIQIEDNQLTYTGHQTFENIFFDQKHKPVSSFSYQFASDKLTIRKGQDILVQLSYQDLTSDDFANKENFTASLSRAWFQSNRIPISMTITGISALILTTNFLFIVFGASFFLFLTKKSRFFHFKNFKECLNFSLNCLGLPTIIASFIGLFGQAVTTILTIQNILFVLVLIWVFFKTKFRDEQ